MFLFLQLTNVRVNVFSFRLNGGKVICGGNKEAGVAVEGQMALAIQGLETKNLVALEQTKSAVVEAKQNPQ
jgi:hypothetical protein